MRTKRHQVLVWMLTTAGVLVLLSEPAAAVQTNPDWMKVDHKARVVQIDLVPGRTDLNNHWNFNGYFKGNATITVPQGYKVVIRFRNADPSFPHSVGIGQPMEQYPPLFEKPSPVFGGAMSTNATSLTESTKPGEQETISFTADRVGDFVMLCYVPAHAVAGMWIHFRVSAQGDAEFEVRRSDPS